MIEALLPRSIHRLALQIAHRARHRWRRLRKVPLAGVSIIARDARGRVLLVRHSYGPNVWALPGGGAKRGEEPLDVARREFREELGCDAVHLQLIGSFEEELSGSPHTAHIVALMADGEIAPDQREVTEAVFFNVDALPHDLSSLARQRLAYWQSEKR